MTATLDRLGAGVYDDIPEDIYHSDPVPGGSLSSTGARLLLQPGGPAKYRWQQDNPPGPKKTFEIGTAAHKLVLGAGPELVLIDAERWDTKDTKAEVAKVRARGAIPLKPAEHRMVHDMADAIRAHPVAGPLFSPERGEPEKTLIWQDSESGIWRRARPDWLPHSGTRRLIVADYKSTVSAAPTAISKAVANYGYHCQHPWYLDGVQAVGLGDDAAFIFVFQEKTAPYLINVVELDYEAVQAGRDVNRRAIALYADCQETGIWPGYGDDVTEISLPRWHNTTFEETL